MAEATIIDLTIALINEAHVGRPTTDLENAIGLWSKKKLHGYVARVKNKPVGFILAWDSKRQTRITLWGSSPDAVNTNIDQLLLVKFVEPTNWPTRLTSAVHIANETNMPHLHAMKAAGFATKSLVANHFGDRDGVLFVKRFDGKAPSDDDEEETHA